MEEVPEEVILEEHLLQIWGEINFKEVREPNQTLNA